MHITVYHLQGGADVLYSLFPGNAPLLDDDDLLPPPYTPHAPHIYADINTLNEVRVASVDFINQQK